MFVIPLFGCSLCCIALVLCLFAIVLDFVVDTSRVSLNENSCGTVVEVLLVSSGDGVGGGDGGLHKGSSGLVVQSTLHNISSGFLVQSSGSGSVAAGPSVSSVDGSDVGKLLFAMRLLSLRW